MEKEKGVVIIDSHALFWLVGESEKLSAKASNAIAGAGKVIIPIIVIFEVISTIFLLSSSWPIWVVMRLVKSDMNFLKFLLI